MAYGDRLISTSSREFEDLIYAVVKDEIDRDYQQRRFDGQARDILVRFLEQNVGNIAQSCFDHYRGNRDLYESEIVNFARRATPEFEDFCFRALEERERRDRGRYDRRDDRRYDGRLNYKGSGAFMGGVPGTFGFGKDNRNYDKQETERDRRARVAANASKREREKDRRQGLNQPVEKTEVSRADPTNLDTPGVTYHQDYAVIATKNADDQIPVTIVPDSIQEGPNHCYHVDSKENIVVGKTCAVDTRKIFVRCPMRSIRGAFDLLTYDNPQLTKANIWCYFVTYLKVSVTKAPGLGNNILEIMSKITSVLKEKNLDPQTKLINLQIILNGTSPEVRMFFLGKILRKWNTLALTEFALPNQPNSFLSAADLQTLSSFYPDTMGQFDASVADKINILAAGGNSGFVDRLNAAVSWVLKSTLEDRCGFVDLRVPNNLPLITMFPDLPFVINGNKRPADLGSMNDEEKNQLAQRFIKDWAMSIDRVTTIVTNLNTRDIELNARVTCCSATDAPVPAYFRTILKGIENFAFYQFGRNGDLNYAGHFGMAANKDLLMVRYKED